MDPAAHFHSNSCPLAAGHRTNRHDSLDPILQASVRTRQMHLPVPTSRSTSTTCWPLQSRSFMDATVDDPHSGSTFVVDFHVVDSLAPSHLRIQKAGDPASQSSLQRQGSILNCDL